MSQHAATGLFWGFVAVNGSLGATATLEKEDDSLSCMKPIKLVNMKVIEIHVLVKSNHRKHCHTFPVMNYVRDQTLNFIRAFVTNWKQLVQLKDMKSSSGVPPGTVLSPLLFIVFINNFPQVITSNTRIVW